MALARVQTAPKVSRSTSTNLPIPFSTTPTVGNAIIVTVIVNSASGPMPSGCTDNAGNTYTLVRTQASPNSNARLAIFLCARLTATATPLTVTATTATVTYWIGSALEVSGVGTGLAVDQGVGQGGTSALPATGSTAALTADEVFVVALHSIDAAQASITVEAVTPAWTQAWEELPFNQATGEADSRVRTGVLGTTQSCSWTDTASASWAAAVVAFKVAVPPTLPRVTQAPIELLSQPAAAPRVTQAVVELLLVPPIPARVTQVVVEYLWRSFAEPIHRDVTGLVDILKETYHAKRRRDAVRNVVEYRYARRYVPSLAAFAPAEGDVLPAQNTKPETDWFVDDQRIASDASLAKYGERVEDLSFEMLREGRSADFIAAQLLADNAIAPVYVEFEEGPCGIDTDLGDVDTATHFDGLTDTARAMRCEEHELDLDQWKVKKVYREV